MAACLSESVHSNYKFRSAFNFYQTEEDQGQIVTFCKSLDSLLEGGVSLGRITELFGEPGVGKTQTCLQLSVSTHIPEKYGGLGGSVVYIDTEGGLVGSRLREVAQATVDHLVGCGEGLDVSSELAVENILRGIYYFRCLDDTQVMSTVHQLPALIEKHTNIKLVIIDNVSAPFRHLMDDPFVRSQVLAQFAQTLNQLAVKFQLAVVLTNQMTTRVRKAGSVSYLVPALGDSWGHACAMRVMLSQRGDERRACLVKGGSQGGGQCVFRITEAGIRDIATDIADHPTTSSQEQGVGSQQQDSYNTTAKDSHNVETAKSEDLFSDNTEDMNRDNGEAAQTPQSKRQKVS